MIFNSALLEEIVQESERYAHIDKTCVEFHLSPDDIRKFLGILLLSGYHSLAKEDDYWSKVFVAK